MATNLNIKQLKVRRADVLYYLKQCKSSGAKLYWYGRLDEIERMIKLALSHHRQ
jgi:hypothetical protein